MFIYPQGTGKVGPSGGWPAQTKFFINQELGAACNRQDMRYDIRVAQAPRDSAIIRAIWDAPGPDGSRYRAGEIQALLSERASGTLQCEPRCARSRPANGSSFFSTPTQPMHAPEPGCMSESSLTPRPHWWREHGSAAVQTGTEGSVRHYGHWCESLATSADIGFFSTRKPIGDPIV